MVNNSNQSTKIKEVAPEQQHSFEMFHEAVMKNGALTKKEKEIIAVAVAHAIGDSNRIEFHTRIAKTKGTTLGELVEAAFVAAALEAGGAITHSTHIQNALNQDEDDVLYRRSNLKKLGNLRQWAPEGFNAYRNFSATSTKEGKLSSKLKELIAVSVAHTTECPYCIDVHTKMAHKSGATPEELSEAVLVTALLCSSTVFSHLDTMIHCYEE